MDPDSKFWLWIFALALIVTVGRQIYRSYWREQFIKSFGVDAKDASIADVFHRLAFLREQCEIPDKIWKTLRFTEKQMALEVKDRNERTYRQARWAAKVFGIL